MTMPADPHCALGHGPLSRALLVVLILVAGCTEKEPLEVPVAVDRIDLTAPTTSIQQGQTVQLSAVPRSASGQGLTARQVTWTSSNNDVATVNANGLVTGVGGGNATITASSGGESSSVAITVIARTHTLTITGGGNGNGTVAGGGINCTSIRGQTSGTCQLAIPEGTVLILTATPAAGGHSFGAWGFDCVPNANQCTVSMGGDRRVRATFNAPGEVTLIMIGAGSGSGNVTSNPGGIDCDITPAATSGPCQFVFQAGSNVTLTAAPVAGHTLVGWSGCAASGNTCVATMNVNLSVTVTFAAPSPPPSSAAAGPVSSPAVPPGSRSWNSAPGALLARDFQLRDIGSRPDRLSFDGIGR